MQTNIYTPVLPAIRACVRAHISLKRTAATSDIRRRSRARLDDPGLDLRLPGPGVQVMRFGAKACYSFLVAG